jgi:hypothetical protein
MLLERNENRVNFKLEITKFFMDWDFSKGPMYPFHKKDMIDIIAGIKQKIKEFRAKKIKIEEMGPFEIENEKNKN